MSGVFDLKFNEKVMTAVAEKKRKEARVVDTPDGFAVSIAYNKSGYQLIPKKDLTNT